MARITTESVLEGKRRRQERQLRTGLLKFAGHRDRIELALPARMLWQCAYSIIGNPDMPPTPEEEAFCDAVIPALDNVLMEPIAGISLDRQSEAAILINSTSDWALHGFLGRPVPTVFMIALRWLEGLTSSGYLVLAGGSAFDAALDLILAELAKCPELTAVNKTAMKNSHRLLERLQTLNLYRGATIPQADPATLTFVPA